MAGPNLLHTADHNSGRLAALCYLLQEKRLTLAWLLTETRAVRQRCGLPAWTAQIPPVPVYTFTRKAGVLRMVPRPAIQGGAGPADRPFEFARFATDHVPEAAVLRVEGEVDLSVAQSLAGALADLYHASGRVIVDFSRVAYLDGAGIRVLTRFAEENPGRFVIVGSSPTIRRLFEILRLVDVLPVMASLGAAREYLGPR